MKREKALWWPLSKDIAEAANRLGLGTLHEVNKSHPRDWENPGRVRVLWKKDGRLMNPIVKTSECTCRRPPTYSLKYCTRESAFGNDLNANPALET